MPNTNAADLLQQLIVQLEHAWNATRDDRLVDRLAAEHPTLAEELYEFFADLVEAELDLDRPRPELAAADDRVQRWLEREGYRRAAAARRAGAEGAPTTTPEVVSPPANSSPATPTSTPRARSTGGGELRAPRPFLGLLREETGESTHELALALDVTIDFLVDVSDNAHLLPEAAQVELADRAFRARGIDRRRSLESLTTSERQFEKAASRKGPYRENTVTYEDLVRRSGLDFKRKRYWLSFA